MCNIEAGDVVGTALGIYVICCSTLEAIPSFVLNYQSLNVRACFIDLKNNYTGADPGIQKGGCTIRDTHA